jgi:hypothetical protein
VFAEETITTPSVPEISTVVATTEKAETVKENRISKLKARGTALIQERAKSLSKERDVITKSKLTDAQKKTLTDIIDQQIANLTSLKVTLDGATDATSTRRLVESVFSEYRIYGIIIPQVHLEKRIFDLQNHITKITNEVFPKVQTAIDTQKAKGKDVTVWQTGLDKAKTTVSSDTATLAALLTKVQALKPADYGTSSKAIIESANTDIKTVSKDLRTINALIKSPRYMKNVTSTTTQATTTAR